MSKTTLGQLMGGTKMYGFAKSLWHNGLFGSKEEEEM